MKPSIAARLAQLADRLEEVGALLATEEATRDMNQYRKLTREHAELEPVVAFVPAVLPGRSRYCYGARHAG